MSKLRMSVGCCLVAVSLVGCDAGPGIESAEVAVRDDDALLVIEGELVDGTNETIVLEKAGAYVGFTFEEIGSTAASDGRFRFETELAAPELLYLSVEGREGKAPLFVGNEKIEVKLALGGDERTTVTGSAIDDRFREFMAAHRSAEQRVAAAEEEVAVARESGEASTLAAAQRRREEIEGERVSLALEWLRENGATTLGAYIGIRHLALQMDVDELEPLVAALDPTLAGTRYYDQLVERLDALRLVALGSRAPDFTGPDEAGDPVALNSLRGQVVLVDFWASWCGPCRVENPELIALYEEHGDEGFEILGVGLEFDRQRWIDAIETDGLPWINVSDVRGFDMEAAQLFAVRALPANVLIDRDGVIVAKNVHGGELQKAIESVL